MERNIVLGAPPPRGVADKGTASTDDMHANVCVSLLCVYVWVCVGERGRGRETLGLSVGCQPCSGAKGMVEGGDGEREVPDEKGCMVSHPPTTAARLD